MIFSPETRSGFSWLVRAGLLLGGLLGVAVSWLLVPSNTYKTGDAAVAVLERAQSEVHTIPGVGST